MYIYLDSTAFGLEIMETLIPWQRWKKKKKKKLPPLTN